MRRPAPGCCAPRWPGWSSGAAARRGRAAAAVLGGGPLLAAVATAAVPAVLTRGLHLDGLADTADGLGSGKPAEDALRIMKQSDIGPFGVRHPAVRAARPGGRAGPAVRRPAGRTARWPPSSRRPPARLRADPGRPRRGAGGPAGGAGRGGRGGGAGRARRAVAAGCVRRRVRAGRRGFSARTARCVAAPRRPGRAGAPPNSCCATARRRFGGVTGDVFGALAETAATTALRRLADPARLGRLRRAAEARPRLDAGVRRHACERSSREHRATARRAAPGARAGARRCPVLTRAREPARRCRGSYPRRPRAARRSGIWDPR